mgnify:CR=1 FL=1
MHLVWGQQNQKPLFRRLTCIPLFVVLTICVLVLHPTSAQAATYTFNQPGITVSKPVNFVNGDFEQPTCNEATAKAQHYVQWSPDRWYYFDQDNVPGWNTIAVNAADRTKPSASSIQLNRYLYDNTAANSGSQYAELNCDFASRLYQYLPTQPGARLYWSFAHAAYSSSGPDVMDFILRPTGQVANNPQQSEIQAQVHTQNNSYASWGWTTIGSATVTPQANHRWVTYSGKYTVPAGQTETSFEFMAVSSSSGSLNEGNFLDSIKFQTGASLVTEKAITDSSGQRIDGGYGESGDTVTVTMKVTNWGETDATPCVLTDTLWDGLQLVPGSGTIDGVASANVNFNSTNNTVTADIGAGATTTTGGTIQGSQSTGTAGSTGKGQTVTVTYQAKITGAPGSTVKDQAKVTYNDKGYTSYNPSGLTSYSTVDYGISDANYLGVAGHGTYSMNMLNADGSVRATYDHTDTSNSETYVNQFTVVDRELDGKVWYDSNQNGKIDSGEGGIGATVKMQRLGSDGTTWTDATDSSGTALKTTTGSSGNYMFDGILPGRYRVLAVINNGQARPIKLKSSTLPTEVTTTTGTQGDYDNDADAATVIDGGSTWQVVQTLDMTSMAYTPTANTLYTHNVDLGRVPEVTIAKGSQVTSTGSTDQGSAGSPAAVTYGDTIQYTLTVTNNSTWMSIGAGMVTVTDALPDGLSYVSSTGGTPTVSGQSLTWSGLPSIPANGSYVITVTARVTKPNVDIFNTARTVEPDGASNASNTTYHHSKGLTLTIGKLVKGDLSDPQKAFTFDVTLGGSQSALLSGLGTTGSTYTYHDDLDGTDLGGGGTMAFGSAGGTVQLKHGQSVTFHDLPMGISYTVRETDNSGYVPTVSIANGTTNAGTANTGSYSTLTQVAGGTLGSNDATVGYTNTKTVVTPTGVVLEYWPYAFAVLLAVGIGTALAIRRARMKRHRCGAHDEGL